MMLESVAIMKHLTLRYELTGELLRQRKIEISTLQSQRHLILLESIFLVLKETIADALTMD
jgi:hypothetical protein